MTQRRGSVQALVSLADALVVELRGGASMAAAIRAVGREHPSFASAADAVAAGVPVERAVADWARRAPSAEASALAAAVAMSATDGAVALPVAGVARTLRDRVALLDEIRALSASAHASAAVVASAPVLAWVLTALGDPSAALSLFSHPAGRVALVVGLTFEGAGLALMARIIQRVA
ncbi:MAG: hypothetical protein ACOYNI_08155 [Acidimicrobiia bacterium]